MKCLLCDTTTEHGICDQCWQEIQNQQRAEQVPQEPEFYSSIAEDADSAGLPITCPQGARTITEHTLIPY